MENTHIVIGFDKDLEKIQGLLIEMGGLVEHQLDQAMTALIARDTELGKTVRVNDKAIDALEIRINERAVRLLALRQPMAQDLRVIVAIMKVSANLERIGDYAKNIAKRLDVLVQMQPVGSATNTLKRMSALVQAMIADVLDAFINRDIAAADDVRARDEEVDSIHNTLFRELLTYMMEDPRHITASMHLLFIAKNIERAGDHTTSMAEQIHYLIRGQLPDEARPKNDQTSGMGVDLDAPRGQDGQDQGDV
jgi:phosphate transport system protein